MIQVMLEKWKTTAQKLKTEGYALYLAARDPRVPWIARLLAGVVVAYAFSPIDLIPDPIPVLGYLDDLLLVPLGVWLALRMIPPQVMAECRQQAEVKMTEGKPVSWVGALIVILIWLSLAGILVYWFYK